MLSKEQSQKVSGEAAAIQAGRDITITQFGLTLTEVRQVALDVFRSNFVELSAEAKKIAHDRAEEVTEKFLTKLMKENPEGINKAKDPDFQFSLYTVQKEYARLGGAELGSLLVDLLVDRSKQTNRNIMQIVLEESLTTAPKLTESQLAVLSVIFVLKYTVRLNLNNHKEFYSYLDEQIEPFSKKILKNMASYQHLQYCGCGSIAATQSKLEGILSKLYQGLFLKGFEEENLAHLSVEVKKIPGLFIPCLNDSQKLQVGAISHDALKEFMEKHNISSEGRARITALFDMNRMNDQEIKETCIKNRAYMEAIFDVWSDSAMKNFTLTSVGMAIGHANLKRLIGDFADLSIWIN